MTQLLKYYTRMLELLKRQGPEGHLLAKEAVNIPSIVSDWLSTYSFPPVDVCHSLQQRSNRNSLIYDV